jgi:hypothetical protein
MNTCSNPAGPQKFGALNMTAALGPFIMRHPTVKTQMEAFLLQHVLPSFQAPEGYLRAMVCGSDQSDCWQTHCIMNVYNDDFFPGM